MGYGIYGIVEWTNKWLLGSLTLRAEPQMPTSDDLLPRVALYQLCDAARREIAELVQGAVHEVLQLNGLSRPVTPAGALKARDAARYIGLSRARLYELLREDPIIKEASITSGRARLFLTTGLDQWLRAKQAKRVEQEAA